MTKNRTNAETTGSALGGAAGHPAQIRRVDNLIFRKINQFARANGVEQATPMHGWIIGYLYRHRRSRCSSGTLSGSFPLPAPP